MDNMDQRLIRPEGQSYKADVEAGENGGGHLIRGWTLLIEEAEEKKEERGKELGGFYKMAVFRKKKQNRRYD